MSYEPEKEGSFVGVTSGCLLTLLVGFGVIWLPAFGVPFVGAAAVVIAVFAWAVVLTKRGKTQFTRGIGIGLVTGLGLTLLIFGACVVGFSQL